MPEPPHEDLSPPLATMELAARLVAAERRCVRDWLAALADEPGDPFRIGIATFGGATALACGTVPAEVFNRVFELTPADLDRIPAILAFYRARGATPTFDLSPYAVPGFWQQPNPTSALARAGFHQGHFHQMLFGRPRADVPPPSPEVEVREVGPEDAAAFGWAYEQVWGEGRQITVLLGRPGFRCYLAEIGGETAGLGVLHVADGTASMANGLTVPALRDRGAQTALLHRRIADAAAMGCDLMVSQCSPGTASQRNQLRAGFHIAGSKAWWVPLPPAPEDAAVE
jgi:hypothetical protein